MGFGEPVAISAEHGEGLDALYDALLPYAGKPEADEPDDKPGEEGDDAFAARPLRLAIIGQPNAGKSTLVNALLGEERVLTGPEAGITRDAIATDWSWQGRAIKLWDTAGIRRKSRVSGKVEKLAVADALRATRFADCVVVLIDASLEIERQDLTLCDLVAQDGKAVVLALSKWDLVEDKQKRLKQVESDLEDVLPEIKGVPVVTLSAERNRGLDKLMKAVFKAVDVWNIRIPTSPAQSLARSHSCTQPAARALGPPHQIALRHAGRDPAADLCALRQSAQTVAGKLSALSDERTAQGFRFVGNANPLQPARRQESL